MIGQGIATSFVQVPGLLGYVSPRGLVDPGALDPGSSRPVKVLRSLPELQTVREEGRSLQATWAITGRLLVDAKGVEIWLNLLDARSGDLLWTRSVQVTRERVLWRVMGLVRGVVVAMGPYVPDLITLPTVFPTGSWEALVSYARALDLVGASGGGGEQGLDAFRAVSRAVALDPRFDAAVRLFQDLGRRLLAEFTNEEECNRLRSAIAGMSEIGAIREMLQLAHNRILALAKGVRET